MVRILGTFSCPSETGIIPESLSCREQPCLGLLIKWAASGRGCCQGWCSWFTYAPLSSVKVKSPFSEPMKHFLLSTSTRNTGKRARVRSLHQTLHFLQKNRQDLCCEVHSPTNAGDMRDAGLISGSGRSSGGGHNNPL